MEDYPKPINKDIMKKILEQMNFTFYIINQKNYNIGFYCFIKYHNKKIPVIIINNYLKNEDKKDSLDILINNKIQKIELSNIIYKNEEYNITIILNKNNNKDFKYIEIDDKLYEEEYEMKYKKESIYILQYNNIEDIFVSYGIINRIDKNKIIYSGNINKNSKYSLIFNLNNNKLIGIHKNNPKYYNYNKGIYFKSIINEFILRYKKYCYNNRLNEINITIQINKDDINKEINFLDNYEYKDENGIIHNHDNLKELNKLNTELYINNLKYDYQKYFIPKKDGIYDIKLKFNINIKDSSYMFAGCKNIININFISFNTQNIINMKYMFYGCINLKKLILFPFNTGNVINMEGIFLNCILLNHLDLSSFEVKNVNNMSCMFYGCSSLKSLSDISKWDTQNVNNISFMFFNCSSLKYLSDISKWDIKNITDISDFFYNCKSLKNPPKISKWINKNEEDIHIILDTTSKIWCMLKLNEISNKQNNEQLNLNLVALGLWNKIIIINLINMEIYQEIKTSSTVYSLARFKENSKYLISSLEDGQIFIYQLINNEYKQFQILEKPKEIQRGEINKVITLNDGNIATAERGALSIWKPKKGKDLFEFFKEIITKDDTCQLLEINPNMFACAIYRKRLINIYKNDGNKFPLLGQIKDVESHGNNSNGMAKINDNLFCSGGEGCYLYVISVIPVQVIQTIIIGKRNYNDYIHFVHKSYDEFIFASTGKQIIQYQIIKDKDNNFIKLEEIYEIEDGNDNSAIITTEEGKILYNQTFENSGLSTKLILIKYKQIKK